MTTDQLPNEVKTTGVARIDVWDGWRGSAICLVLIGHFYDIKWLWEDRLGVDAFFVLSGMLMSTILFEKRLSLKDFYIRRLSRVFPVLFVYILAIYAFSWIQSLQFSSTEFVSSLVFLRTYYPSEPGIWSSEVPIGHLWSLNVEEHAYIVLSVLTLVIVNRKYIGLLLLALGCGSIALSFHNYSSLPAEDFKLYLIRTESAIVFILFSAGFRLLKHRANWASHPTLTVICLLGTLLCYAESMPIWLTFSIGPILLSVAVNSLDNLPKTINWALSRAPLRYMGIYSYSIYIWQQFFYEYYWAFPTPKILTALLPITIGIASYHLLENPIRRMINSRWSKIPTYHELGKNQ